MARQTGVPHQLAVFTDPAAASKRMGKDLAHVERRPWGAVATVPWQGRQWTVAAFVGDPGTAARVAAGHAERTFLNQPLGNYPIAALVALAAVGVAGVLLPWTVLPLFAILGFFLGLPIAQLFRALEARRVTNVELDDDLRLVVQDEKDGLLDVDVARAMLKAALGERAAVVACAQRVHHLLALARECPDDMGIRDSVSALLADFVGDPAGQLEVTLAALDELTEGVQAWRRANEVLVVRADEPVSRFRRRDRGADEQVRRERARSAIQGSIEQLQADARARREAAEEL